MRARAALFLDSERDGSKVVHPIGIYEEGSELQALRAAHAHVEAHWESIGKLIEDGETLRIEVARNA